MRVVAVAMLLVGASSGHAAAGTIDDAFPPTVRVAGAVSSVAIAVHSAPAVTWIAIDLPSSSRRHIVTDSWGPSSSETELDIDLPSDARVVGVIANGSLASPMRWNAAVTRAHDGNSPTLAKWASASGGLQHIAIATHDNGHLELAVVLQPYAQLRVDVGKAKLAATIDDVPVAHPDRLALQALPAPPPLVDTPTLDETTWFLADDHRMPTIQFGDPPISHEGGARDKRAIRRTVKWHQNQLRQCYESQLLAHPTLAGHATLSFLIVPDGTLARVTADGDLPDVVNRCLADEAASWTFPEDDSAVEVHYPLTFVHAPE